jgi:hypothetical protein
VSDGDSDGLVDAVDICPADPDCDGDDVSDGPSDPDGGGPIVAGPDNCPSTANTGQEDAVHPGNGGDHCDDPDSDTVFDIDDNCPDTANPGQTNTDFDLNAAGATVDEVPLPADALGDVCDDDDDNDSFNGSEVITQDPGDAATSCPPGSMPIWADCMESYLGTDPTDNCGPNAWPPDTDDNSRINAGEFGLIIASWQKESGEEGYIQRADLDGNGRINAGEFGTILPYWQQTCT